MKKKLLLFLLTVCSLPIFGKQITVNEASQIARVHQSQNSSVLFRSADIQLVKTVQGNSKSKKTQKAPNLYYVFDKGNNHGYIIIAADDVCTPVIGYTTEGTYNEEDLPPNYIEWMEKVQQGIEEAILKEKKPTEKVKKQWQSYLNFTTAAFRLEKSVSPLIKTAWSQAHPFWNSIPVKNQSGKPALTGCVATAMAQIMKYHKFPSKGILATSSYTTRTLEIKIPSIDIIQYTYDWDNMLTGYNPGLSNAAQEKAVADLMYHCGAALHMDYNYGASNAYANDVAWVLKTYFGYDPKIQYLNRRTKTDDEWISILKINLDNNLPISYAGSSSNSGHVFICDGYDAQGLFHFNWGWNGSRNGYYSIDATLGFTMEQNIVHNIKPLFVSTYNKVDKEGLRKVLRQGRNLSGLGLTASDTLSWEKSEEWVSKVKGVTWKDSEQGKRISRIYWWSQFPKLTGTFDITPFPEIEEVIFPFNAVTAFKASDNSKLKKIDAGYNNMTEVMVNNCAAVNTLLVHFNRLEKINVTNWNSVTTLYVYNNKFRFSTLPLKSIAKYAYDAQARIEGGTISAGKTIDLSSEYSVDNTLTQYKWYNGSTEITLASNGNGKFVADPKYVNTTLTCKMTNLKFPRFTLEYTVKIEKSQGIYNESDKEGLRNILNQGSNYTSVGLSDDDLKNWNISEEWVSKVKGVTWKDSEQGKRISRIYWWNHPIKITGTIDITPFPEIEEAIFPFNAVTAFKASGNSKLKKIDAGYNNMTEVMVNNCSAVNTLLVHFNRLEKINVTNWNLITTLFTYNNKFRFSTLPLKSIVRYSYDPQARIEGGTISAGKTIDLSSEYSVDNTLTQYKWYNGSTEITLASNGNGKFVADPKYVNTTLTCKMTNLKFPRFTLEYTVKIEKSQGIYNESDKEGLRNILNQGSNYTSVGLSDDDLKNWNISEEWVSKVKGVTWKDSEQGKRISRIYWWNHPIKITGTIDITPFPEIEEAIFPFNAVTAFKASGNSKLKKIDAGYNNMTEVTVNNCAAVNTLLVHFNRLEKINVTNWNLITTLFTYNNKFRFSTLPLKSIAKYSYDPQARIEGGTISAGKTIDLSSEYSVDNTLTQYKWYNGSTEITLASNGNGKFIADPKYLNTTLTCKMTNSKFPRFTLEYTIYLINPTTLYSSDIISSDISIYPNPVIDILHFDTFNEIQSIEIYNFDGKLIKQEKNIKNNRIDVRLLSSGIYLLTVKTNTQQSTLRFIKK